MSKLINALQKSLKKRLSEDPSSRTYLHGRERDPVNELKDAIKHAKQTELGIKLGLIDENDAE